MEDFLPRAEKKKKNVHEKSSSNTKKVLDKKKCVHEAEAKEQKKSCETKNVQEKKSS